MGKVEEEEEEEKFGTVGFVNLSGGFFSLSSSPFFFSNFTCNLEV